MKTNIKLLEATAWGLMDRVQKARQNLQQYVIDEGYHDIWLLRLKPRI